MLEDRLCNWTRLANLEKLVHSPIFIIAKYKKKRKFFLRVRTLRPLRFLAHSASRTIGRKGRKECAKDAKKRCEPSHTNNKLLKTWKRMPTTCTRHQAMVGNIICSNS